MGEKLIPDNGSLFPHIQALLNSNFSGIAWFFQKKNIYEKIVCYTGTLTDGHTGLTPDQNCRSFDFYSYASHWISSKINSFQDIQHNLFQDTQRSNFAPLLKAELLDPKWDRFHSIGW